MTHLDSLAVRNLRVLRQLDINQTTDFNLITGNNGSGKTTTLEAIYLLGHGRSFRTNQPRQFICRDQTEATIRGKVGVNELCLRRNLRKINISINGTPVSRREVIGVIPVRKFIPQDHHFIEGGSIPRRQFLDWGPFHLDFHYADLWRRFVRALRQRNASLKNLQTDLTYWDNLYCQISEQLHQSRKNYWEDIQTRINETVGVVVAQPNCSCHYWPGWSEKEPLLDMLRRNHQIDRKRGYTSLGPHRADIVLRVGDKPANQQLSRGQQKMWNLAMNMAQVEHFYHRTDKKCVWLIDDLASELDARNFSRVTQMFRVKHAQYWLTSFTEHTQKFLDVFEALGNVQITDLNKRQT